MTWPFRIHIPQSMEVKQDVLTNNRDVGASFTVAFASEVRNRGAHITSGTDCNRIPVLT